MKANEFFKKVGIEAVRSYVAAYEDALTGDLKRLVESHELVEKYKRGRGIPKELWEQFIESYIETMPSVIGKSVDVVKKQASHLANKFQVLKTHEKKNELLPKFVEMLALYTNSAPDAEQYAAPIEFLLKKAEEFMNSDKSTDLAENLGFS